MGVRRRCGVRRMCGMRTFGREWGVGEVEEEGVRRDEVGELGSRAMT